MEDKCVMCGAYVPEGSMVCWDCANPLTVNESVSYIDPILFTLWSWKVYKDMNSIGFYAIKDEDTVVLSANILDGLVELIIMREKN
jgi:predicted amidophosphoribosyltransferase